MRITRTGSGYNQPPPRTESGLACPGAARKSAPTGDGSGDGSNRRLELEPCAWWLEVKSPANCVFELRNRRGIKPPTAVGQFVRFRRADSLGLGRGSSIVSQKIAKGTKSFVVFAVERAEWRPGLPPSPPSGYPEAPGRVWCGFGGIGAGWEESGAGGLM